MKGHTLTTEDKLAGVSTNTEAIPSEERALSGKTLKEATRCGTTTMEVHSGLTALGITTEERLDGEVVELVAQLNSESSTKEEEVNLTTFKIK